MAVLFGVIPLGCAAAGGAWYYGTNKHVEVGYAPEQPVDYSHKLHAGDLGVDCRYCHSTVESSAFAAVPPTETCMNCHAKVRQGSPKLLGVQESWATDKPIAWVRVHNLPDYVYFDHSAHLAAGVGCVSCHGRVDQMPVVRQVEPLSMGWCLDCHRDPGPRLVDRGEVTKMDATPATRAMALGAGGEGRGALFADAPARGRGAVGLPEDGAVAMTKDGRAVRPPLHCSGCHR